MSYQKKEAKMKKVKIKETTVGVGRYIIGSNEARSEAQKKDPEAGPKSRTSAK